MTYPQRQRLSDLIDSHPNDIKIMNKEGKIFNVKDISWIKKSSISGLPETEIIIEIEL